MIRWAEKKDRKKGIRTGLQIIILLLLLKILYSLLVMGEHYQPYTDADLAEDSESGFVALSYFALDRSGTDTIMSAERLQEHFEALEKNGFQTISQADLEAYYKDGSKRLPERALFLMFEDGRRDTAMFSAPLLEDFNFMASLLTYGDKLQEKDLKFLSAKDLLKLEKTGYFELGTNGYRLAYINVFDREGNFLGEMSAQDYSQLKPDLKRDYNHYLMDFIRDKDGIPLEDYQQMKARIGRDYDLVGEVYQEKLGQKPKLNVLMHANTGQFASNDTVSQVNEAYIRKDYGINFNREGFSYNQREISPYDLTRMQPQANWYANHLLMRIQADTGYDLIFEEGLAEVKKDWQPIQGVAEYRDREIILTSEPSSRGLIRLDRSLQQEKLKISLSLEGNKLGRQRIYLAQEDDLEGAFYISVEDDWLVLGQGERILYSMDLADLDEAEDGKKVEAEKEEIQAEIQLKDLGQRALEIWIRGDLVQVDVDQKPATKDIKVQRPKETSLYLEAAVKDQAYSQRNLVDDVYDGVFSGLLIESGGEQVYSNRLEGLDAFKKEVSQAWKRTLDWFIENL